MPPTHDDVRRARIDGESTGRATAQAQASISNAIDRTFANRRAVNEASDGADTLCNQLTMFALRGAGRGTEAAIKAAVETTAELMGQQQAEIVAEFTAATTQLRLALLVEQAKVHTLTLQSRLLERLGADSPSVFADSDECYANGARKTKMRVLYERTFDKFMKERGVSDPERYR